MHVYTKSEHALVQGLKPMTGKLLFVFSLIKVVTFLDNFMAVGGHFIFPSLSARLRNRLHFIGPGSADAIAKKMRLTL